MEEGNEKTGSGFLAYLKPPYSLGIAALALIALAFVFPSMAWLVFVMFGLGFALTRKADLMAFGYGLAGFAVLSVIMNLLHIPLNWAVFLGISAAALGYFYYKKEISLDFSGFSLANNKTILLILLFFAINTYVFWVGATSYPYLEDDDPWLHAIGAKWISEAETFSRFYDGEVFFRTYMEPYPPAYDVLMGVIHQMTVSVSDTLKFYNALLCGLTLIMAFFAFFELTKNKKIALLATFFLLIIPGVMSHFIWAQTLAILLMFVALHGYEKSVEDKNYLLPAGVAVAAIAVTQPSTAVIFIIISAFYFIARFYGGGMKAAKPLLTVAAIGITLSLIYYVPVFLKYGLEDTFAGIGMFQGLFDPTSADDTSGGVVYGLDEILFPPKSSKIDQAVGIGLIAMLLALLGAGYCIQRIMKKDEGRAWMLFAVILLVFTFLGTEGNAMPVKLFPHRFWVFFSIPVALLAGFAYTELEQKLGKTKTVFLYALLFLALLTSADAKLTVQTVQWPPGGSFYSNDELIGYVSMRESLPKNTLVFPLCGGINKVIGSDMDSMIYDPEVEVFSRDVINRSAADVHSFLKGKGFSYLTLDSSCAAWLGQERTQQIADSYAASGMYTQEFANNGFLLLRLD
ncbi:MAG: hypothetical protein ABIH29_02965 [Candidatus Micrarchaeota archaeon]